MGTQTGLDRAGQPITLYTEQTDEVVENLLRRGRHHAKREFIERKYGEASAVFLDAYAWFAGVARQIVPKPEEADFPIWTVCEQEYLEQHPGHRTLVLEVPIGQAVFFRMADWNKRLNLRYIGTTAEAERAFSQKLERFGVAYEGDVYTTPFFPHLKKELTDSWINLFRYDAEIKRTGDIPHPDMQASLWQIDAAWIKR